MEVILDGRSLPRPVNYALVRVLPPEGVVTDSRKRPFIVFDPRAGHGPGIGGMKHDSEIGVALAAGHPCYFVGFLPEPVPGQTVEDVCHAEARFVTEVAARHPAAEGKPCLIGNCQAGWQIMLMAALHPELAGPIMLAGSPLSYWAGVRGKNPMRYLGGILGGSWMTAMVGDLGKGIFDGANLVANFELLHPANTLWKKPYDVYSKVDTEASRFLEFEKWWGSPVLLNAVEMQSIADELFIGNKLSSGELRSADGTVVDLRNIRSPIVVFCSRGDDITPPQQALGWILDLYEHESEIVAAGQTIVYSLHQSIGHLGIFVSGKVATKEHGEFTQCMDLIDLMPPGLYEAVITGVDEGDGEPAARDGRLPLHLGGAKPRGHPRPRRQYPRGGPVLRRRRPGFRDQPWPLPRLPGALRRAHLLAAIGRFAPAPASQPASFRDVLRFEPRHGAGPRRGRGRPQRPPAGGRRQSVARRAAGDLGLDHRRPRRLDADARSDAGDPLLQCLWVASAAGDGGPGRRRRARSLGASAGTSAATSPPAGWRWSWNVASTRVA